MHIHVLQHTPNEGPGAIRLWAEQHGHQVSIYHPAAFSVPLPPVSEVDLLVLLGGPMSPNDSASWILAERELIRGLLAVNKPIFGACFGAQQIAKALGAHVQAAPAKEVGWAPVVRQTTKIPDIPEELLVLHWHQEMFELPEGAELLFSSDALRNQGFLVKDNVVGLQFHFEPLPTDVREIVLNDGAYALEDNILQQDGAAILSQAVPPENARVLFALFDYITG